MTIYLDNAASTLPSPEVIQAVGQAMRDHFANPSSLHGLGAAAARALATAREEVAALVHAEPEEIVFTGSGTEANALGVVGTARASRLRHLVISAIEHAAVFNSARMLGEEGWQVALVSPEGDGRVTVEAVLAAVKPETSVVAIMLVNNEIGTVQPVPDIARALRALGRKIHFHVDAVQFAGLEALDVRTKGADSIAISAHKLHGPKGIGALWLRKGKRLASLYGGGGQERDLRSGTENLPAAVGFGVAAAQARNDKQAAARVCELRDRFESLIFSSLAQAKPAVPMSAPRAPHIASILLPGLPAEPILHALEAHGVFASEGAACSSHAREQSRVQRALGVAADTGVLRFSLSRLTTSDDVEQAARALTLSVAEVGRVVNPGARNTASARNDPSSS
jgi:cysteine desulfurase